MLLRKPNTFSPHFHVDTNIDPAVWGPYANYYCNTDLWSESLTSQPVGKAVTGSDLVKPDEFVLSEVEDWRFTPPTRKGLPVKAQARLPIPIRIQ